MAKIQIRKGVFETNSSSVHSLTMCSEEEFEKWKNGDLYKVNNDNSNNTFITKQEAEYINAQIMMDCGYSDWEDVNIWNKESGAITYEEWENINDEFEQFEEHKNINGVDVVAFGYYGHD